MNTGFYKGIITLRTSRHYLIVYSEDLCETAEWTELACNEANLWVVINTYQISLNSSATVNIFKKLYAAWKL